MVGMCLESDRTALLRSGYREQDVDPNGNGATLIFGAKHVDRNLSVTAAVPLEKPIKPEQCHADGLAHT